MKRNPGKSGASLKRQQSLSPSVREQLLPLLKLSDEHLMAAIGELAAKRARQARLAKGLTIRQAAKLAGVPESALRRLEGQRV